MSYHSEAAGAAGVAIFMIIFWIMYCIIIFAAVAAAFVSRWFIFKKMGMPGWKGIIPYYGEWLLFREVWTTKMFWVYVISGAVYGVVSRAGVRRAECERIRSGGVCALACDRFLRTAHPCLHHFRARRDLQAQQPSCQGVRQVRGLCGRTDVPLAGFRSDPRL